MKVCVIGFPRSRSSLLYETISLFYNIPILPGERITEIINGFNSNSNTYTSCHIENMIKYELQKDNLRKDGVIRIHPIQFSYIIWKEGYSRIMMNLDSYDFKHYDQIYFSFRNSISDTLASTIVAYRLGKYTYRSKDEIFKFKKPIDTIINRRILHDYIYSCIIYSHMKKYFDSLDIKYTELEYNEIPKYIESNFPNVKSNHVETNYDYKNIVKDYDKLEDMYYQDKDIVVEKFYNKNTHLERLMF